MFVGVFRLVYAWIFGGFLSWWLLCGGDWVFK